MTGVSVITKVTALVSMPPLAVPSLNLHVDGGRAIRIRSGRVCKLARGIDSQLNGKDFCCWKRKAQRLCGFVARTGRPVAQPVTLWTSAILQRV